MTTRRLTFAVGTGLLTASLATGTVGCKKTTDPGTEGPHVNEGPEPDGGTEVVNTVPDEEDTEPEETEAETEAEVEAPAEPEGE